MPDFYFTCHPGDMSRTRLPAGVPVMLVASAHWDADRRRFRVRRPPADHVGPVAVDSGGFTAARRWGDYPWTHQQYVDFVRETTRDVQLVFCAVMDYACERGVNRSIHPSNRARIDAGLANEQSLRALAPDLPWLAVLQGDSPAERTYDLVRRCHLGLLPAPGGVAGIGSICGRRAREAAAVIRWYGRRLPGVSYHAFGLDVRALDVADDVALLLASWDSYAWLWARGRKFYDRPGELHRRTGETWSQYVSRLAHNYRDHTIQPRLARPRQLPLLLGD